MRTINFGSRVVMLTTAIVLASGELSSASEAVTDTAFRYSTPQTGSLMLGPTDFEPEKSGLEYSKNGGFIISTTGDAEVCFIAPLHLPQQARFERMTMFYSRAADAAVGANLRRVNVEGANYDLLANPAFLPGPITVRGKVSYAANAAASVINNRLYNYSTRLCLTKNAAFYNLRIDYTYSNAGD